MSRAATAKRMRETDVRARHAAVGEDGGHLRQVERGHDSSIQVRLDNVGVGFGAACQAPVASGMRELGGRPAIDVHDPDRWGRSSILSNRMNERNTWEVAAVAGGVAGE